MANEPPQQDHRRRRALLSAYYPGIGSGRSARQSQDEQSLDSPYFKPQKYFNKLLKEKGIKELLKQRHVLESDKNKLNSDLKMLVYENYNKFISATDTIKLMKENVGTMQGEMERLSDTMESVSSCSDAINENLSAKRDKIEQLSGVNRTLKKLQFLVDLPHKIERCGQLKEYGQAVDYYTKSAPVLQRHSNLPSFRTIARQANDAIDVIRKELKQQVAESKDSRHLGKKVELLLRLNEPVAELRDTFLSQRQKDLLEAVELWEEDESETISRNVASLLSSVLGPFSDVARIFITVFCQENRAGTDIDEVQENFREWAVDVLDTLVPKLKHVLMPAQGYKERFADINNKDKDNDALDDAPVKPDNNNNNNNDNKNDDKKEDNENNTHEKLSVNIRPSEDLRKALQQLASDIDRASRSVPFVDLMRILHNTVRDTVHYFTQCSLEPCRDRFAKEIKALSTLRRNQYLRTDDFNLFDRATNLVTDLSSDIDAGLQQIYDLLSFKDNTLSRDTASLRNSVSSNTAQFFKGIYELFKENYAVHSAVSKVRLKEKKVDATSSGSLILSRVCLILSSKGVPDIGKQLQMRFNSTNRTFDATQIGQLFERCAERLLLYYVELEGHNLSLLVHRGIETAKSWKNAKEPRDVKTMTERLVSQVQHITEETEMLYPGGYRSHSVHSDVSSGRDISSSLKSMLDTLGTNNSLPISNMERLFGSTKLKTFRITTPEFNTVSIVGSIINIVLKSYVESVRLRTFDTHGFQQMQVDMYYLNAMWRDCVDDEEYFQALIDEVLHSAADRCTEPKRLPSNVIESICEKKIEACTSK